MAAYGKLPNFKRYITTHDDNGKAIISDFDSDAPWQTNIEGGKAAFSQLYVTKEYPVDMSKDKDVESYKGFLEKPPGIVVNSGTVLRVVDMAPGAHSPMHRTVSLDYGVVLIGEVELELDNGVTQLLKQGDVCVQRGTIHAWNNVSQTEWARMMYVLQPAKEIEINGRKLGEDYGTMEGIEASH